MKSTLTCNSVAFSSNATITYHQNTNVMDQIVLAMNKERNTPGLTTLLSDKKVSSLLSN